MSRFTMAVHFNRCWHRKLLYKYYSDRLERLDSATNWL